MGIHICTFYYPNPSSQTCLRIHSFLGVFFENGNTETSISLGIFWGGEMVKIYKAMILKTLELKQ